MTRFEFRVVVKREGCREKARTYRTLRGAQRRFALLGPEPWTAFGRQPDELFCCDGAMCSCGGRTVREASDDQRANMPRIEYARIERRRVGKWVSA